MMGELHSLRADLRRSAVSRGPALGCGAASKSSALVAEKQSRLAAEKVFFVERTYQQQNDAPL